MKKQQVILTIFFLLVFCSLVNAKVFIYETLIAYFLFTILSSVLIAIAGLVLFKKGVAQLIINPPIILMLIWVLYLLLHAIFINNGFNLRYTFLIASGLLVISSAIIFSSTDFNFIHLFRVLMLLAIVESLICIAQYFNIIESKNIYFGVSGTWVNPNVTAMFLAMALPPFWYMIKKDLLIWKKAALITIILCAISIALLNCRTAIIGAVVGTIIVISSYDFIQSFMRRTGNIIRGIALIPIVCLVIISGFYLYQSKQASSEGRQLIWKISMKMIQEHPFTGYGYGLFERNYNLFQAEYFKEGMATEKEILNSGHVRMAYNEILENTIEGGIAGLLLFIGFLFSLIYHYLKYGKGVSNTPYNNHIKNGKAEDIRIYPTNNRSYLRVAFAGVIVFGIMSMINFTIQAIPCMALYVIYGGILASRTTHSKNEQLVIWSVQSRKRLALFSGVVLLVVSFVVLISQLQYSNSHFQLKTAIKKHKSNDIYSALRICKRLEKRMEKSDGYLIEYTEVLMDLKMYQEAINQFNKAEKITSDPNIFINKGYCYTKIGNISEAKKNFQLALDIQPNLFTPKFSLMKLSLYEKDTTSAIDLAKMIVEIKPKIPSEEVEFYKKEAKKLLMN